MRLPTALRSRKRPSLWRTQSLCTLLCLTAALLGNSCNSSTDTGPSDPPVLCTDCTPTGTMVGRLPSPSGTVPVSYTHLDVYKRQVAGSSGIWPER